MLQWHVEDVRCDMKPFCERRVCWAQKRSLCMNRPLSLCSFCFPGAQQVAEVFLVQRFHFHYQAVTVPCQLPSVRYSYWFEAIFFFSMYHMTRPIPVKRAHSLLPLVTTLVLMSDTLHQEESWKNGVGVEEAVARSENTCSKAKSPRGHGCPLQPGPCRTKDTSRGGEWKTKRSP